MPSGFRFQSGRASALLPAAIVLCAAAILLALGGSPALANHVSCGETITADTTLDSNLTDCPNHGVVIGADDITLNLNGHVIDGDGTQAAGCDPETEFCDLGVLNEGHDGITVRNGSVRQFAIGVFIVEARRNHVLDVSSSRNTLFGALLGGASRSVIRNSSLSRNIAPEGDGLGLFGSDHNRILHNSIRRNPGPGIHVGGSANNLIKGNRFVRNAPSVVMEEADGNRVRRNHVVRGAGILVAPGNRNVIARNRVSGALDSIAIEKGRGNVVARNAVVDSRGAGIRLALVRPPIGGEHTIVRRNRVRRSGEDGFLVNAKDRHSVLKRNVAIGSDDDGFDVESHSATLAGNRAIRNDDLGIEADDGVTDGGGNTARDNGDPRECTNIRCG